MAYTFIIFSSFIISALTFFSGFGLATVLTPVFILFFPIPVAISLTAIVHFLNNLFKFLLVGKNGNKEIILKFGLPAILGAVVGSFTLLIISKKSFIISYHFLSHYFHVELINLIIGILILIFALLEILPQTNQISLNKNLVPFGGLLSGFFGGLSGHQGAFRSIFLLKCNLSKEQFITTGIIVTCLVDIVRLTIYGTNLLTPKAIEELPLLSFVVISSFWGSYLANKYMQKVTIKSIKITISIMLVTISIGLITGLI